MQSPASDRSRWARLGLGPRSTYLRLSKIASIGFITACRIILRSMFAVEPPRSPTDDLDLRGASGQQGAGCAHHAVHHFARRGDFVNDAHALAGDDRCRIKVTGGA